MYAAGYRLADNQRVAAFLESIASRPTGLVFEGEAGIGRTTRWAEALDGAHDRGMRVLSARVGQAESVMGFAALADLLGELEPNVYAELPALQRLALDRALLRAGNDGPATDQRTVAAGFLAVLRALCDRGPVLVAVDDAQWLDSSSRAALEFALRRVRGPLGLLLTELRSPGDDVTTQWAQLDRPGAVERATVAPMTSGELHTVIADRTGRALPRPTLLRITEMSAGNPLFALELAQAVGDGAQAGGQRLPATLAEVVRRRIGLLDDDVRDLLLFVACAGDPTIEMLSRAAGLTMAELTNQLAAVESAAIVTVERGRVRFGHPLLARGISADAAAPRRRAVHRALAAHETLPEMRARHLALASASGDQEIFAALDHAADSARGRGAPAAAAELIDLGISLGDDSPVRLLKSAENHFLAGDPARAGAVLGSAPQLEPGILRALALSLLATVRMYQNEHAEAAELLRAALDDAAGNVPVTVQVLLRLSFALNSTGELDDARRHSRDAVKLADELGVPAVLSAALAWWVLVNFQSGRGLDERALDRALGSYDSTFDVPIIFRAPFVRALTLSWTGRLEQAHRELTAMRHLCLERGAESDLMAVAGFLAVNHLWRGRLADATAEAAEAVERAEQLGGDDVLIIPMTVRAAVAAYAGREADARRDARWVQSATRNRSSAHMADWPGMTMCFLEESLGHHRQALEALDATFLDPLQGPKTELIHAWHLPDVVEAMVGMGRLDEAETVTAALERNGTAQGRTWMSAVGARCRAMLTAARGDVVTAEQQAVRALAEHEHLPMPFERARTQLLLGQLQRRLRQKHTAATHLTDALQVFERLGTPLWAQRARAEMARTVVAPSADLSGLTPSEQRVAELAASGATNKDIAAAMFISTKTVEHNLTKVYRKLGIGSRAELGRRMDRRDGPT